jgi:hypothetical protein
VPTAIAKLVASAPAAEFADKLMLYGRFVGSWDVVAVDFDEEDGSCRRERRGEWHFSWVLGGRGVQDVLHAVGSPPERFGTTLRCYDHAADVWRVSWMAPAGGEFVELVGRDLNGRIEQIGHSPDPTRIERWTFSEITDDSFLWQGEVSRDEGQTWRLIQEMRATRRDD